MKQDKEILLLARQSYQRRRLVDGARIAPVLGCLLFLLPLFAPSSVTATLGIYLFAMWFLLILITGFISVFLGRFRDDIDRLDFTDSRQMSSQVSSQTGSKVIKDTKITQERGQDRE